MISPRPAVHNSLCAVVILAMDLVVKGSTRRICFSGSIPSLNDIKLSSGRCTVAVHILAVSSISDSTDPMANISQNVSRCG